jgi:hypothetical protein
MLKSVSLCIILVSVRLRCIVLKVMIPELVCLVLRLCYRFVYLRFLTTTKSISFHNTTKGGVYEKSTQQNFMEGLFHYTGCLDSSEVPAEIYIGGYLNECICKSNH